MTETAYIEGNTYKQRDLRLAACREQERQQSSSHIIYENSSQDVSPLLAQDITPVSFAYCVCIHVRLCVCACVCACIHACDNVMTMLANVSPS